MQVCTSFHTDNNTSTPQLSFLQAGCPSCRPTNSIKAPKALFVLTEQKFVRLSDALANQSPDLAFLHHLTLTAPFM